MEKPQRQRWIFKIIEDEDAQNSIEILKAVWKI